MKCLGVPRIRPGWSVQTKRLRVLGVPRGSSLKGAQVKALAGRETVDHRAVGEVIPGT